MFRLRRLIAVVRRGSFAVGQTGKTASLRVLELESSGGVAG